MLKFFKNAVLILLSISFLGFTGKEKFIELNGSMNARSSGMFTQSHRNILFTMGQNTKAEIISHKRFQTGNYGLQVRISSGPHKNKVIWVYHNVKKPTMALYESCPRSWSETGVAACKGSTANPERANASVVVQPTPATAAAPIEIPTLETVTVHADSVPAAKSEAVCTNCSAAAPKAPITPTYVDQLQAITSKNPLTGAYRVMADLYQSCHVLNLPPITHDDVNATRPYIRRSGRTRIVDSQNTDDFANSHYYMRNAPEPRNPSCQDMTNTPPVYVWGGKPKVKDGVLDIFSRGSRRGGAQTVGLDCSGFVSSAFTISGLKLRPSTRDASQNTMNSSGLKGFTESNSCFKRPTFTKDQTIASGDVVAWNGHTYMIDKVGQDPFGIAAAKASGKFPSSAAACSRFQPNLNTLDFTIIQSTGYGSLPAMRIEAKNYKGGALSSYKHMAIQACKAQYGVTDIPRRSTTLIRHKGDSAPECTFAADKIPKLAGEECTQGCFKEKI